MLNIKIKELRTARNMSQVQLAAALGVTKQSISNWENNNIQPSVDMLIKIARLFSVSTDYLLCLNNRQFLEVDGLSQEQCAHIQQIINDIASRKK